MILNKNLILIILLFTFDQQKHELYILYKPIKYLSYIQLVHFLSKFKKFNYYNIEISRNLK